MSEQAYALAARVDNIVSDTGSILFGPWTQWNPLSNGWAVGGSYTAAWVRRAPGNMVQISAVMDCSAGTRADLTTIGTIPASDADGNQLRPSTNTEVPMTADLLRVPAGTYEGSSARILTTGVVQCYGVNGSAARCAINAFYPLDSM